MVVPNIGDQLIQDRLSIQESIKRKLIRAQNKLQTDRFLASANNITILSNEYVEKTRGLLVHFNRLPLVNFASMWLHKYNECIDFSKLKYKDGLIGFLDDNNHLFELTREGGAIFVALKSRPVSSDSEKLSQINSWKALGKQRLMDQTISQLFRESNYLWADRPWTRYLKNGNIIIATSAYESALDCRLHQASMIIDKIRQTLQHHPQGLRVDQFYKFIQINQALKVFSVSTSVSSLVDELPEIFFRRKSDKPEEDLIFDAALHTVGDMTGRDDGSFEGDEPPERIVINAINGGLYQKTLILIRETGQVRGLKINVWMQSLKLNFYINNETAFERDLKNVNTLTFFFALARYNLLELRSHHAIKNDIRAFLPRKYAKFDLGQTTLCDPVSD